MNNINMIFGAPGCGKTTRLMSILEKELIRNDPNKIAFVSFTRKGTYEGAERAKDKFDYTDADIPYFRTLHSIAFRLGQFSKYDMISKKDYKTFSDAMGMRFTGYYTEEFFNNDDKYLFMYFLKRNNPTMAVKYMYNMDVKVLHDVEHNFVRFKEFARVFDFTDIIERFIAINEPLPIKVAIIDEAQDLTTLQWKMCEVAFRKCERVYIAGDDDQAIYEWSGADVQYFLNIKATSREVLKQSYRLQKRILQVAGRISNMIKNRVEKDFKPIGDSGDIFTYNRVQELKLNGEESYYFLARNNWFLSTYRDFLRQQAQVFIDKNNLSYDPKHIGAINIFEHARRLGKLIDTDEVKIKLYLKDKVDLLKPWYDLFNFDNDMMAYYKDLIRCKTNLKDRRITVNTIHGVKGGEADNVVLMLDFTKAVRTNMEQNPDSELRCLYVACTRTKKHLHIIHSTSKNGYDDYINFNGG